MPASWPRLGARFRGSSITKVVELASRWLLLPTREPHMARGAALIQVIVGSRGAA